jgi:L-aspartate oxidase
VADGRCVGVSCLSRDGVPHEVRARHVLLAAGGAGQVYAVTTNPAAATGDGVAMALRAGAAVADVEFFQFHPTALHHPSTPRPLLTEALRGHGAKLRDAGGERFVDELLPRDVVSRAILATMLAEGADHVWLDCRDLEHFTARFPTIAASLAAVGLDATRDLLPVAPAAHHLCGGVLTDLDGATTLPGLWAAGEVACTGVHGANRLASNSLLEGMVFAPRSVEAIVDGRDGPSASGAMRTMLEPGAHDTDPLAIGVELVALEDLSGAAAPDGRTTEELRHDLQTAMMADAGVVRSAESLGRAAEALLDVAAASPSTTRRSLAAAELDNLVLLARTMVASALAREESRGTHHRSDFPESIDSQRRRLVHRPRAM